MPTCWKCSRPVSPEETRRKIMNVGSTSGSRLVPGRGVEYDHFTHTAEVDLCPQCFREAERAGREAAARRDQALNQTMKGFLIAGLVLLGVVVLAGVGVGFLVVLSAMTSGR